MREPIGPGNALVPCGYYLAEVTLTELEELLVSRMRVHLQKQGKQDFTFEDFQAVGNKLVPSGFDTQAGYRLIKNRKME